MKISLNNTNVTLATRTTSHSPDEGTLNIDLIKWEQDGMILGKQKNFWNILRIWTNTIIKLDSKKRIGIQGFLGLGFHWEKVTLKPWH